MPIDHFPHYQQLDVMDCGPSCLRMVAKHYGKSYTLETLRERCFVTREGVSMLGICDAAEYIGMRTMGVRTTIDSLVNEAHLPCILHWNQKHFVVCYKIKKSFNGNVRFYIADPASHKIVYRNNEFKKCWVSGKGDQRDTGIALLLEPGPDFWLQEDERCSPQRSLLFFIRYLYLYKREFFLLAIAMIISGLLQMLFPFLAQAKMDFGIRDSNIDFITLVIITELCLILFQLAIDFIRGWIILHINLRLDISLISDFLMKLTRLPLCYFDTKMTGDIMQRIGDHSRIKDFLMGQSFVFIFTIGNFIFFSIILAYYNWLVLTILIVGNIIYVFWITIFMQYRRRLDTKRFYQSAGEQSKLIQMIQGIQEIKLNNCERQKRWEWERIQVKLYKISQNGLRISQIQQTGSFFFLQTTNVVISFLVAKAVIEGQISLGMMMSITYIIGQISAPINSFINFAHSYQDAKISLERLNEVYRFRDEERENGTKMNRMPELKDIVFDHVSFSYSGADRDYAVEDVCIRIPEKKVTAIVGASGSGKTTILKLLLGFYKPLKGTIKIGGDPLDMINSQLWRSKIGAVMQEGYIFSDTIARNIALVTEYVNYDKLNHSIRVANLQDFIHSLPMGYETKIGMEGNGVSQGQRQRILIARTVYKDPEFVFFDEATNSLDANNETIIMNNLKDFYKGRTILIIAHRLSTVMNAHKIIVMDKGKVVEEGTHKQLINKRGTYYKLVKNQIELGNE